MRYVVLRHEVPADAPRGSHWDLMFDVGATLRTWAVETEPDVPGEWPAAALPDHRREYLTYEGPVSGNRGTVTRWDEGTYELPPSSADAAEAFVVRVEGRRLHGTIRLTAAGYAYQPASRDD